MRCTPLLELGPESWIKAESLQRTGSFKLRGATNALRRALPGIGSAGVIAHSSGNHAQAVAYAARRLGVKATCVMPCTAPEVKRQRVAALGAEIVEVGPASEERAARAREIAHERGALLVPSANDRDVIAGQATVGLELVEQLSAVIAAHPPDAKERCAETETQGSGTGVLVLVPIGGGGLASGVALAVKGLWPDAKVVGVEPALAADAQASYAAGEIVSLPSAQVVRTIADGLRHSSIDPLPFAHLRSLLDGIVAVEEEEIVEAIATLAADGRLVVEPSGAVSVAALRHHRDELPRARRFVCVISGGNVELAAYVRWVQEAMASAEARHRSAA